MDALDNELIKLLQRYGFQSGLLLASRLKKSHRTIQRHLKRMRDEGVYKVIAVPNFVSFGNRAWAKIGINVDPAMLNHVANTLAEHPSVYFVAYSLGTYNIIIAVAFPELDRLTYFVNHELTQIKGITSKETMLLVRPVKYYRHLWPGHIFSDSSTAESYLTRGNGEEGISALDVKILGILAEDGLARPAVISQRLGIAESLVRKRIKYMKDSQAITFEVVPNQEVLEDEAWATIGINTKSDFNDKMLGIIINDPDVYLTSVCLGRFDLIIAARFKNIDLLTRFVSTKLASISGINSVQTFIHNRPIKYHNIRLSEPGKPEAASAASLALPDKSRAR